MEIENYFVSLAALVPLVVLIADFGIRWLKIAAGWGRQLISWLVSAGICFLAMILDIGIFEGLPVLNTIVYALAAGLVSNGVFDIGLVQMLLDFLLKFVPKRN